jgi:hypothetical protein
MKCLDFCNSNSIAGTANDIYEIAEKKSTMTLLKVTVVSVSANRKPIGQ